MSKIRTDILVVCAIVIGIVVAGFLLQLILGSFDLGLLRAPVNLFFGAATVLLCIASAWISESRFALRLTEVPMAVGLISALLVLCLIMGLTPQGADPVGGVAHIAARLGFNGMTSSWPFVLVYSAMLISLGCLAVRRVANFRLRDTAFCLNHIGLWLVLFASGLGYADIERYVMRIPKGEAGQWALNDVGHPHELPFTVSLTDFEMEDDPRPKYISYIEVGWPDGNSRQWRLEVNRPFRSGFWNIYQYGYDLGANAGPPHSTLEIVRDPWSVPVYVGFAMIAAGAAIMIRNGKRRGARGSIF